MAFRVPSGRNPVCLRDSPARASFPLRRRALLTRAISFPTFTRQLMSSVRGAEVAVNMLAPHVDVARASDGGHYVTVPGLE
jgi:hypothetical protein